MMHVRLCQFVEEILARIQLHRLQVKTKTIWWKMECAYGNNWRDSHSVQSSNSTLFTLSTLRWYILCLNSSSRALKTRSKHSTIIGSISQTGKAFIHLQQHQYQNIRWPGKEIPSSARSSPLFPGHCELNLASELNVLWENHYYEPNKQFK